MYSLFVLYKAIVHEYFVNSVSNLYDISCVLLKTFCLCIPQQNELAKKQNIFLKNIRTFHIPHQFWCHTYVLYLMNHMSSSILKDIIPSLSFICWPLSSHPLQSRILSSTCSVLLEEILLGETSLHVTQGKSSSHVCQLRKIFIWIQAITQGKSNMSTGRNLYMTWSSYPYHGSIDFSILIK